MSSLARAKVKDPPIRPDEEANCVMLEYWKNLCHQGQAVKEERYGR